jgi:hypothetical protein
MVSSPLGKSSTAKERGIDVDAVAALVIIGTALSIGVMALLAWAGAVLLHRVLGHQTPAPSGQPSRRPFLVGGSGGKHRPGRNPLAA